ncbi:MAG: hypothetical protein HWE26_08540 [Alteromonadaceae bacterium]|nr:hypothetical protein [Alteromonadaceae bacterium]
MRKLISSIAVLTGVLSLLGCVSQPHNVRSNLPLVNQSYSNVSGQFSSQQSVSSQLKYAKAIPELRVLAHQPVVIDGMEYQASASYMSAMGTKCHRLVRSSVSGTLEIRPVCDYDSYWLLYPALVTTSTQ